MKKLRRNMYKHLLPKLRGCIGLMFIFGLAACTSPEHNSDVNAAGSKCADTLFINGKVRTVSGSEDQNDDDRFVAVRDNQILAVLGSSDISRYSCETTKTIDLKGKTIMPGFVEPHTHPDLAGQLGQWVDISGISGCGGGGCKDWQQVKGELEKAVQSANEGIDKTDADTVIKMEKKWVYAFGYDPILTPDLKDLSLKVTDGIAPDNPMLIMSQSMHTVYANSTALKLSGIDKEWMKLNPGEPEAGEIVVFSKDGENYKKGDPTGRFEEAGAVHLILGYSVDDGVKEIKEQNIRDQTEEGVPKIIKEYGSVGITTVGVPGMKEDAAGTLKNHLTDGSSILAGWLRTFWYGNPPENNGKEKDTVCSLYVQSDQILLKPNDELNPHMFDRLGTKFWYDGSPYTASMYMDIPYLNTKLMKTLSGKDTPGNGRANYKKYKLKNLLTKAHNDKCQLSVHSQGDRSSEEVIKIIKKVLNKTPAEDPRPRLEHLALINKEQVKEAVEAGILLNFHILHLYYYGEALRDEMIGEDRARRLMPIKWALDAGSKFSLHTDAPMYPPNPLLTVRTAVTRLMKDTGQKLGSMQAIPVDEAIKAITINAAYQLKMEDYIGSIEVGKYADFVILKEDPYEVAAPNIDDIEVCETYVNGVIKYKNSETNGECI